MAEDFHAAVDGGDSDKHINSITADGVAFAVIQGLPEQLDEKNERIVDLKQENAELCEGLATLEEHVGVTSDAVDGGIAEMED